MTYYGRAYRGILDFNNTYDANKNKTAETIPTGHPMHNYGFSVPTNGYDDEDQLVAWQRTNNNPNQSWTLSKAGDWNSFGGQNRTHNSAHGVTAINGASFYYEGKGSIVYDGTRSRSYTWDENNLLSSTRYDNCSYDAFNRRVMRNLDMDSGRDIKTYISDGQQEIMEYGILMGSGAPTIKYIYADYVDEPVMMVTVEDGEAGPTETKYYYHQNNIYSTAAMTDQSSSVVERYSYDAYGRTTFHNADGTVKYQDGDPERFSMNPYSAIIALPRFAISMSWMEQWRKPPDAVEDRHLAK